MKKVMRFESNCARRADVVAADRGAVRSVVNSPAKIRRVCELVLEKYGVTGRITVAPAVELGDGIMEFVVNLETAAGAREIDIGYYWAAACHSLGASSAGETPGSDASESEALTLTPEPRVGSDEPGTRDDLGLVGDPAEGAGGLEGCNELTHESVRPLADGRGEAQGLRTTAELLREGNHGDSDHPLLDGPVNLVEAPPLELVPAEVESKQELCDEVEDYVLIQLRDSKSPAIFIRSSPEAESIKVGMNLTGRLVVLRRAEN